MALTGANFVNMQAAGVADFLGNGAIEVPEFQTEINDIVRRNGVLGQRIEYVPATGAISRWFDQTAIADGQYTDPRNIAPTATSPTRVEKSLVIKGITNQINYSLFDLEVTAQQNIFSALKAKDMSDMVNGIVRLRDKGLWVGNDTVSGNQVGNGGVQYVGLLNQVSNTTVIASGSSIVDGIRTQVAQLVGNASFNVMPTAIYIHPIALDYMEQELKNNAGNQRYVATDFSEVKAGLTVSGIYTAAGLLPLIPEPFLTMDSPIGATPIAAAPANQHNYPFAIVTESLIEFHYVGSKMPRVFQLGTLAALQEQYVGVMFGAPVAKLAGTAHVVGAIQRA